MPSPRQRGASRSASASRFFLIEAVASAPPAASARVLGADPAGYARQLFATLHDLDEGGFDVIIAEPVPDTAPWRAIADRLRRAGVAGDRTPT